MKRKAFNGQRLRNDSKVATLSGTRKCDSTLLFEHTSKIQTQVIFAVFDHGSLRRATEGFTTPP